MRILRKLTAGFVFVGLLGGWPDAPRAAAADYSLPAPQVEVERAYLGLPAGVTNFQLEQIHGEILVVDCFDMYCHVCQSAAKHVRELYDLVQQRGLGDRVKFIGLGVGDTPLEVSIYKEKFKVPFPVFPDRHGVVAKRFGELRIPNIIILKNHDGHLEVVHRSPGTLLNPADLLPYLEPPGTQSNAPPRQAGFLKTEPILCDPVTGCGTPAVDGGILTIAPVAQ